MGAKENRKEIGNSTELKRKTNEDEEKRTNQQRSLQKRLLLCVVFCSVECFAFGGNDKASCLKWVSVRRTYALE